MDRVRVALEDAAGRLDWRPGMPVVSCAATSAWSWPHWRRSVRAGSVSWSPDDSDARTPTCRSASTSRSPLPARSGDGLRTQ